MKHCTCLLRNHSSRHGVADERQAHELPVRLQYSPRYSRRRGQTRLPDCVSVCGNRTAPGPAGGRTDTSVTDSAAVPVNRGLQQK